MKTAVIILMVVLGIYGGFQLLEYYDRVSKQNDQMIAAAAKKVINEDRLEGMNPALDSAYRDARNRGLLGLRGFLENYKGTPHLVDPKLAYIEMDYVLLLAVNRPDDAKKVFQQIRERLATNSIAYPRLLSLESQFSPKPSK